MLAKLAESGPRTIKSDGNLVPRERRRTWLRFEATSLINGASKLRQDFMRKISKLGASQRR